MTTTKADQSCQLYAIAETGSGDAPARRLEAALGAAAIAAVLIVPPAGRALEARQAGPLIALAKANGAAAILLDDAGLAKSAGADGVHLSFTDTCLDALKKARDLLSGDFIIGADAGTARDDAMRLGERGADYIAFSLPPAAADLAQSREQRYERIAWWAEIFELRSVALGVEDAAEASRLAQAGADFVTVDIGGGRAHARIGAQIGAFAAAIRPRQLAGSG